jgi:hypothetical protein
VEPFFGDSTLAIDGLRANARVDRTLGKDAAVSVSGGLAQTKNEFFNLGGAAPTTASICSTTTSAPTRS